MRRSEKEIKDQGEINYILRKAHVVHVAMCDDGQPYLVPMNYGLGKGCLYLHCSQKGRKIDILKKNNAVCFEMETDCGILEGDKPCDWTMKFRSVIGFGKAAFIDDPAAKAEALSAIMDHYSDDEAFEFPDSALSTTCIIRIDIESISGKRSSLDDFGE